MSAPRDPGGVLPLPLLEAGGAQPLPPPWPPVLRVQDSHLPLVSLTRTLLLDQGPTGVWTPDVTPLSMMGLGGVPYILGSTT